jgi:hypothetical protein
MTYHLEEFPEAWRFFVLESSNDVPLYVFQYSQVMYEPIGKTPFDFFPSDVRSCMNLLLSFYSGVRSYMNLF